MPDGAPATCAATGAQLGAGATLPGGAPVFDAPTALRLEEHYHSLSQNFEYGFASACRMAVPQGLAGKTVVDVCCRRGKGVFKLSAQVGDAGRAIGIDWNEAGIREAANRMGRAWRKSGLTHNNMAFYRAYPEELVAGGVGRAVADVAFVNSVLHLTCAPLRVLSQLYRVLKPGGLLVLEVALADAPRDAQTVAAARALGNSVQAAPGQAEFEAALRQVGFAQVVCTEREPVNPAEGYLPTHAVPVAPSAEQATFSLCVLHAVKP